MKPVLCLLLAPSADAWNAFADLPLRGWEVASRAQGRQTKLLLTTQSGAAGDECLSFVGINQLLTMSACAAPDTQLWSHDAKSATFHVQRDAKMCLDVFITHGTAKLGVYWCHGQVNQQFRPHATLERTYCALDREPTGRSDYAFCVTEPAGPERSCETEYT